MYYIDTSVLVAYYCPEPISEAVERFLRRVERPAISSLTEVELVSAIARKVRDRELKKEDGNRILNQYKLHRQDAILKWIVLGEIHFQTAFSILSGFSLPLKALDALHLSVAMAADLIIVSADGQLLKAAKILGIKSEAMGPGV